MRGRRWLVLGGIVAVALACNPRARTAVEPPSPKPVQPSSHAPTLSTEHLCGHYRVLLTIQRGLDRAEASDYLVRCFAVFEQHRQVMSPSRFAEMATCASMAAMLEGFASCAGDGALLPIEVIATSTTLLSDPEERAKELYWAAEQLARQERWAEAIPAYVAAYYLVPGKHGFAHKIGVAAWNARDCNMAEEYLEHFVRYAEREKYADKLEEAKQILGEIAVSGCSTRERSR